jgi:crotonobetainyl-CoA:carnitine CoA-transferase CaiB-like acyl-CoA transferase
VVTLSRDLLAHPQLQARGFFEELDHPVVGRCQLPAMPIRLGESGRRWLLRAAPTLGQHNAQILTELLGQDDASIAALSAAKVIGTRPAGL